MYFGSISLLFLFLGLLSSTFKIFGQLFYIFGTILFYILGTIFKKKGTKNLFYVMNAKNSIQSFNLHWCENLSHHNHEIYHILSMAQLHCLGYEDLLQFCCLFFSASYLVQSPAFGDSICMCTRIPFSPRKLAYAALPSRSRIGKTSNRD